ncbi:hypothetical protein [Ehrlichia canis]|nr:hypothetical protein [Ehrlichia canis]
MNKSKKIKGVSKKKALASALKANLLRRKHKQRQIRATETK